MAKARAELTIDKPADVVWARIRNYGDVSWIPKTGESRLEGTRRFVRMQGRGIEVMQDLLNHDDENRTYSYRISPDIDAEAIWGAGAKVPRLEAVIAVHPRGESSWLTYDVDTEDFMVNSVQAEYQGALENLRAILEG